MQILIGAGLCLFYLFTLSGAYYLGYKQSKPKHSKLTPQQKQKAKQNQEEFAEMMSYSLQKAVRRT